MMFSLCFSRVLTATTPTGASALCFIRVLTAKTPTGALAFSQWQNLFNQAALGRATHVATCQYKEFLMIILEFWHVYLPEKKTFGLLMLVELQFVNCTAGNHWLFHYLCNLVDQDTTAN